MGKTWEIPDPSEGGRSIGKKRNKDVETRDETIWYLLGGWPKKHIFLFY